MNFRDAVKHLRSELGLTQSELANALHVNYATVGRWERGQNVPNRSITTAMVEYARARSVSPACMEILTQSIAAVAKERLNQSTNSLFPVEHESLSQLIEGTSFPIYVCDLKTNDLLYINRKARELLGGTLEQLESKKCYTCLMHSDVPCAFCHKEQLTEDEFVFFDAFLPQDNTLHQVQAKLIQWNGRTAQVRYLVDLAGSVSITSQRVREIAYTEQLRVRQQMATDSIAMVHFDLTHNKICAAVSKNEMIRKYLSSCSIDELLAVVAKEPFTPEDRGTLEEICSREALIKQFYMGRTHFKIQHTIGNPGGYYKSTFDLVQNPITYDIEAIAVLRDITEATLIEDVAARLFCIDYETIATIDALTGEARPYIGHHIDEVIAEQKKQGDNRAGVEVCLRKYCVDQDADRVILETSLPYVKNQLVSKQTHSVIYLLKHNDTIIRKRVVYTYLDRRKTIILCAMQDMTAIYHQMQANV